MPSRRLLCASAARYAQLDARRQPFVVGWVERFNKATGQALEPGPFYDTVVGLSTKTTFEAITHALMTIALTDRSGSSLGDALTLVERVEAVRGEVAGARSDRQFRMYVRLTPAALETLARSREFNRSVDNTVYHRGYPTSYRGQGGAPSVQISVALDGRRGDIDVDYRAASFPVSLFNGHLTASNSDVRAGANFERHVNRWTGLENWWRSFFGVRQEQSPDVGVSTSTVLTIPRTPRAGRQRVEVMADDFLRAWLVEGDVIAAMGYVSERSYACLAEDDDDPAAFDRGMAPFKLMMNLKAAHETLGSRTSLEGLVVGTRLAAPALRVVRQPHHAQFVVYQVPDDVAARFDCESRLTLGDPSTASRVYGNYAGSTFYIDGGRDFPVALLWAKEDGYWKIVSWRVGGEEPAAADPEPVPVATVERTAASLDFVAAAHRFLEQWLIRKDPDAAFAFVSSKAYACYNLERGDQEPAATPEEAGRRLRASLETAGKTVDASRGLGSILAAAEPTYPAVRVMAHPYARAFSLTEVPDALADAAECAARAVGVSIPDAVPLVYGHGFGMTVRFKTKSGDAPVLRLLWRNEAGGWRITSYALELP